MHYISYYIDGCSCHFVLYLFHTQGRRDTLSVYHFLLHLTTAGTGGARDLKKGGPRKTGHAGKRQQRPYFNTASVLNNNFSLRLLRRCHLHDTRPATTVCRLSGPRHPQFGFGLLSHTVRRLPTLTCSLPRPTALDCSPPLCAFVPIPGIRPSALSAALLYSRAVRHVPSSLTVARIVASITQLPLDTDC